MDLLLAALLAALVLTSLASGGTPGPQLRLFAMAAVVYVFGRVVGTTSVGRAVTGLTIGLGTVLVVVTADDGLSGNALAGPLGYGNANGALCTVATGSVLVAAASQRSHSARRAGLAGSVVPAVLAAFTGSLAATLLSAALVVLAALLLTAPPWSRAVPLLSAGAVLGAAAVTVLLAITNSTGPLADSLSHRRVVLWAEAVALVRGAPVTGVGAGRFRDFAPTAVADPDAAWAHSAWLQHAAETGALGGLLLLAAAVVPVLGACRTRLSSVLAAATSAALLVHASVDYILHVPAVVTLTVLVSSLAVTCTREEPPLQGKP